MPQKTLLDIGGENFDLYFAREIEKITPEAKDKLPADIRFKLFRRGGEWNSKSTSRLRFLERLLVFLLSLKKEFILVVADEEKGIGLDQFIELRKSIKDRDLSVYAGDQVIQKGSFYLGDRELMSAVQYLNQVSTSPAYNFLLRAKNLPENNYDKADKEMLHITRFLMFWEGNKKTAVASTGLAMAEIYVLLYLFDGKEKPGSELYQDKLKRAYQATSSKIRLAFTTLYHKGLITKYGGTKGLKLQITSPGKVVARQIITKYAVNW